MPWPPILPPATRTDLDAQLSNHPDDHNAIATALADLVARADAAPVNGCMLTFVNQILTTQSKTRVTWGATGGNKAFRTEWRDPGDPAIVRVPSDGFYRIDCQLNYSFVSSGAIVHLFVNVTGAGEVLEARNGTGSALNAGSVNLFGTTMQYLNAGDAITVDALSSDDGAVIPYQSFLAVTRLGP